MDRQYGIPTILYRALAYLGTRSLVVPPLLRASSAEQVAINTNFDRYDMTSPLGPSRRSDCHSARASANLHAPPSPKIVHVSPPVRVRLLVPLVVGRSGRWPSTLGSVHTTRASRRDEPAPALLPTDSCTAARHSSGAKGLTWVGIRARHATPGESIQSLRKPPSHVRRDVVCPFAWTRTRKRHDGIAASTWNRHAPPLGALLAGRRCCGASWVRANTCTAGTRTSPTLPACQGLVTKAFSALRPDNLAGLARAKHPPSRTSAVLRTSTSTRAPFDPTLAWTLILLTPSTTTHPLDLSHASSATTTPRRRHLELLGRSTAENKNVHLYVAARASSNPRLLFPFFPLYHPAEPVLLPPPLSFPCPFFSFLLSSRFDAALALPPGLRHPRTAAAETIPVHPSPSPAAKPRSAHARVGHEYSPAPRQPAAFCGRHRRPALR
ncbi:hypothetical protein RJ55_07276 [Drechmeria coniospora]|nr:hypothetical protein RJ55_07276 [Drechmeria coniospora]